MSRQAKRPVNPLPEGHQIMIWPMSPTSKKHTAVVSGPINPKWIEGMPPYKKIVIVEKTTFHRESKARAYMAKRLGEFKKDLSAGENYRHGEMYPLAYVKEELLSKPVGKIPDEWWTKIQPRRAGKSDLFMHGIMLALHKANKQAK